MTTPFHFLVKSPKGKQSWKHTMKLRVSKEMKMTDCPSLYVGLVHGKLRGFKNLKLSAESPIVNREPTIQNQGIHA